MFAARVMTLLFPHIFISEAWRNSGKLIFAFEYEEKLFYLLIIEWKGKKMWKLET